MYPSTRVIVDATEIPIEKPSKPTAQQATFSTYKNTNTLKVLVGANPSGLISFASEAFGGSTSDRQIFERSVLPELCSRGDSIMADREYNVQDIFESKGVAITIPAFLRGKDHLSGSVIMRDRRLASKRVHIERLIGQVKVYHIWTTKLNHCYVQHGSDIFFVCFMLSNFREDIVSRKA
ncbi:tRNA(Ile)-lysidine synthase [Frankliniella fusca]|uniref:tRNA(Ile)-lysidine synthase n=1 Tax=Frankliniella fusca TaxID=407009 RepID=A0AAE1L5K8_9NEOP|nr:tRNA(Ile)-lysidine synthase [Frankliniella fusca]